MGPPPDVIGHLVGPPRSSWPTVGCCISNARFEAWVICPIEEKSEPCDPPGGRESAWIKATHGVRGQHLQTLKVRHWEAEGSGGRYLGKGQGRRSRRTVQIARQKTCLPGEGIFKSIARCCKTMLLVGRGHRKQTWKQQISRASSPWFYRPGSRHASADMPVTYRKNELWSQQCFPQKLRERCLVQENLLWPPPWSRPWVEVSQDVPLLALPPRLSTALRGCV